MPNPVQLSKADARRALARHHFAPCQNTVEAFERLRSIQFDPIAPVGCNHDLVLQARVAGYRIGDWESLAYQDRHIYDGWDKQASLVPFSGWPVRRIFHRRHNERFERVLTQHPEETRLILKDLEEKGPLLPSGCSVKTRKEEWKASWLGPNLSKQILRSLWHTGRVMTSGRKSGNHLYDLAERVVPPEIYAVPEMPEPEARAALFLDRHQAIGLLRPTASYEVWSYYYAPERKETLEKLLDEGLILPVEVEGVKANATPGFLENLDKPSLEPRVVFVAPLDQLLWDRKLVQHVFNFDYVWEIYMPEAKRTWGYYVLPVLFGDVLVARAEFWCRKGKLELKRWFFEPGDRPASFFSALEEALSCFMSYCGANECQAAPGVDARVAEIADRL